MAEPAWSSAVGPQLSADEILRTRLGHLWRLRLRGAGGRRGRKVQADRSAHGTTRQVYVTPRSIWRSGAKTHPRSTGLYTAPEASRLLADDSMTSLQFASSDSCRLHLTTFPVPVPGNRHAHPRCLTGTAALPPRHDEPWRHWARVGVRALGAWLNPDYRSRGAGHSASAQRSATATRASRRILWVTRRGGRDIYVPRGTPRARIPPVHPGGAERQPGSLQEDLDYELRLDDLDPVRRAQLRAATGSSSRGAGVYFKREWVTRLDVPPADLRWVRAWDLAATPGLITTTRHGRQVSRMASGSAQRRGLRGRRRAPYPLRSR